MDRAARDRHRSRRRRGVAQVRASRRRGCAAPARSREAQGEADGSSRRTTTSSCAASRPTSRRCRRSRSARRRAERCRLQPEPGSVADHDRRRQHPRVRQDRRHVLHVARLLVVGDLEPEPVRAAPEPGGRDPERARARARRRARLRRSSTLTVAGSTPEPASATRTTSGCAAPHAGLRERRGRRPRVVDPEAEREAAGPCGRGAVEDDVVAAGDGAHGPGGEHGLAELRQVRVEVDRQRRVAGEPVLVSRRDDPRLDPRRPGSRRTMTTPKFATGFVSVTRNTCSGPRRTAETAPPAGTSGTGSARRETACPACRRRAARARGARSAVAAPRPGPGDAEPERDAADVGAARQPHEPGQVALGCGAPRRPPRGRARRERRRSAATTRLAPAVAAIVSTATSQTPAPPPASVRSTRAGTVTPGRTRPKETEAGDARTSGTSALSGFGEAAAAARRGGDLAVDARRRSPIRSARP